MQQRNPVGTVIYAEGRYLLEADGRRREIPIGPLVDEAQLKELVGKEVEIFLGEPPVLGVRQPGRPGVICYYPPPDFWHTAGILGDKVRLPLLKALRDEGWISQEVYDRASR